MLTAQLHNTPVTKDTSWLGMSSECATRGTGPKENQSVEVRVLLKLMHIKYAILLLSLLEITARCPYRGDPPYGSIKRTGYTPGSTIHYTCKKGFKLVGDAWQKCLYTGYWSGEEPVCNSMCSIHRSHVPSMTTILLLFSFLIETVGCPDLDDPPYGSVNVTDNTPGSTAHYECNEGFELVGDDYRQCLNNSCWSGEEPVCKSV